MPSKWRALRRRVLTPSTSETLLDVRGFHKKTPEAQKLLETIGASFLTGYGYAAEAATVEEAEQNMERLPLRFRGFAYEGAGMGFAVRDGLPFGGSHHVADFMAARGAKHVYMAYIGIGWAMARLPRFRWPNLGTLDPMLVWLVLDGFGFHQAYFRTARYVGEQYQEPALPWTGGGPAWYVDHAIDQGIGRALWFVGGTDPDLVATMIDKYAPERHPDLYAGAGLAATYAGGVDTRELEVFAERAGQHLPRVAQGSAFASEARVRAELLVPHTALATRVFCGMEPDEAAALSVELRPEPGQTPGDVPAYEQWRRSVAARFGAGRR